MVTKTAIGRAFAALGTLVSCGCDEVSVAPAAMDTTAASTVTGGVQSFCEEFRGEANEYRDDSAAYPGGWPTALPGMTPLQRNPAPSAVTMTMLGPPCPGGEDLWAVPATQLTGNLVNVEQDIVAVTEPSLVTLSDGRTAFFAIASEGHYHAADAFGVIAIVDAQNEHRAPLFAMPGSGTWGEAGGFDLPGSDAGSSHIWSTAGDVSFGDVQGWAGLTDLSGQAPRALGRFLTYGRHTCVADESAASQCHGAWEYAITSIAYAPNARITLTWRFLEFDERRPEAGSEVVRERQRARSLTATYDGSSGTYRYVEGEEPPRIE